MKNWKYEIIIFSLNVYHYECVLQDLINNYFPVAFQYFQDDPKTVYQYS